MSTATAEDPLATSADDAPHQTMQCMEIRGGNEPVDTVVSMPGIDAWVYSKPYRGADDDTKSAANASAKTDIATGGGDVHYVSSCATGRVTRLLVADVSGHGHTVGEVAGDLRTLMRRFVNYIDQTEFVRSMNRQFVTMSADDCFATAVVTTFFAPTNTLYLCNAGHPPPLWFRAKRGQWEYLELDDDDEEVNEASEVESANASSSSSSRSAALANIPLGVVNMTEYEQFEVTLDRGDLVLCYTDSLIESLDPAGDQLGQAGLMRIARKLDASDPSKLIPALLAAIAVEHDGNLDGDDVTALLFQASGSAVHAPLRKRILAPLRIARGVLASFRRGSPPAPLPEFTLANIGGAMFGPLNRLRRRGTSKRER